MNLRESMGMDASQLHMIIPSAPKPRRPVYGKGLESLVLASLHGVVLDKIPHGYRHLPGPERRSVRVPTPFDFFGIHLASRRLIVLDCKEGREKHRLDTSPDHFTEFQRQNLMRYGEAGAISGLLCESIVKCAVYFLPWWRLSPRTPSMQWDDMEKIGPNNFILNAEKWDRIIAVTDAPVEGVGMEGGRR